MYNLEISPPALKFLEKLTKANKHIAGRIVAAIDRLTITPCIGKKLTGDLKDYRSLRVGDYRIIYIIIEHKILIEIVNIGHRREIYR
jgi:mRNA interferase RelE/StbE